MKKLFYIRFK